MEYNTEKTDNYLRIIERTRLLCNSTNELSELVGSSIESGNGLHRKGGKSPFMKDAVFRELAYLTKEKVYLDLEEVIETYQESCIFYKKMKGIRNRKKLCQNMVLHFFGDQEYPDSFPYLDNEISERHIPLLILVILEVLPCINEKKGDVKDINCDYNIVLEFLKETVSSNIPMQVLPAIGRMEDEIIKHPEIKSRIHLIYLTNYVLCSYGALSNKERISQTIKELEPICLNIEGIWETNSNNTEFWVWEEIANGYNLYKYSYNSSKNELLYIKYFTKFYNGEDGIWAIIIHPKSIRYIISNKPIPNKYFSYYHVMIKDDVFSFIPFTENDKCINIFNLKKCKNQNYWNKMLKNSKVEKNNIFLNESYTFELGLAAITENYIYINKETGLYQIPKKINSILDRTNFGDNIGIIRFNNGKQFKSYIAFDDYSLYFDISTPEKQRKNEIESVDYIDKI